MNEPVEQLAIIKKAEFGWHPDFKDIVLVLDVTPREGIGAMIILDRSEGCDVLQVSKTTVDRLVGKPIWIRMDNNLIRYVRPWTA